MSISPMTEKEALLDTLTALQKAGWKVSSVWDGEELHHVETPVAAVSVAEAVEEAHITVKHKDHTVHEALHVVWGNAPDELIADHSVATEGFSDLMDKIHGALFPEEGVEEAKVIEFKVSASYSGPIGEDSLAALMQSALERMRAEGAMTGGIEDPCACHYVEVEPL